MDAEDEPDEIPPARLVCLDLDTFFVSVERLLDPSLVGVPVVVGATGWRGVVTSASYEVRAFGVRSGMAIAEARRLAPDAVYLLTRHGVYGDYADRVREVLLTGTDQVQTASIDEFFLDFRGCETLWARGQRLTAAEADAAILRRVWEIRDAVQREVGLPASAGVASTRAVAKMASRLAKPAGVYQVPAGGERTFVANQPVRAFPGIGPVTEAKLVDAGIRTLGELLDLPPGPLRVRFGGLAATVRRAAEPKQVAALGADRPAFHEHDPGGRTVGSISNERTFHADAGDAGAVDDQLRALVERVCWRARRRGVVSRTVTVKLRTSDFHTVSRAHSARATAADAEILPRARELLQAAWTRTDRGRRLPVRLVGVALSNLEPAPSQLVLPLIPAGDARSGARIAPSAARRPAVSAAIDAVRDRFGYDAIRLGAVGSTTWLA